MWFRKVLCDLIMTHPGQCDLKEPDTDFKNPDFYIPQTE